MRAASGLLSILLGALCYFSYTEAKPQEFVDVGCFRDSVHDRALPDLIANYRVNAPLIDWDNITKTIQHCARIAQNRGYIYFGIQFWGECWASKNGHLTYDKYGPSTECMKGVGKGFTNFVYRNTGVDNECKSPKILDSKSRAMTFHSAGSHNYQCDDTLKEGWYQFKGGAGNAMATTCLNLKDKCDTLAQGWLQSALPGPNDGIVPGKVCYQYRDNCCSWNQPTQVRNCGRFYVFKLKETLSCPLRYCGNGK